MSGMSTIGAKGPAGEVSFNYIPLIDVTFNLIIFFVLTSDVQTTALARVLVPQVDNSMAVKRDKGAKNYIVINVVSQALNDRDAPLSVAMHVKEYDVNGKIVNVDDVDGLVRSIRESKAVSDKEAKESGKSYGDFFVEIRADKRLNYGEVKPVMAAVSKAEVSKMSLTAGTEK